MTIDNGFQLKRLSDIISLIKIPFFIFIVFIQNTNTTTFIPDVIIGPGTIVSLYYYTSQYISEVVSRIAVPGFFLISGYLFFLNTDFDKNNYISKLKKRVKTLLVPYLFWNLLFICYYFILPIFAPSLFQEEGHEITLKNILCSLWVTRDGHAINQFWYVRDLMVCTIFSPLFYYLFRGNRMVKMVGIITLFLVWFFGLEIPVIGPYGFSSDALFFFGMGALLGMNSITFTSYIKTPFWVIVAFVLSIADLLACDVNIHPLIHNLYIITGLIASFYLVGLYVDKKQNVSKNLMFLSSASFFVYAVHLPWIIIPLRKGLYRFLNPSDDMTLLLLYFVIVIVTVLLSLLLYYIMSRFLPRFTSVVTGGRLANK